jgi:general stress protein 26
MKFKEIFEQFLQHSARLKVVFVGSCDPKGKPNVAPKMLVCVSKPNKVFFIDYKFTRTYSNVLKNKPLSLAFMDDKHFTGWRLNGAGEVVHSKKELEKLRSIWNKKVISYEAERLIHRVQGQFSTRESEALLPEDFVVVKFTASEASIVKPDRVLRALG